MNNTKIGKKENVRKADLKISGMHCASCALNIERSLKALAGVKGVALNEPEVNEKDFSMFLFYFSV